MPLLPSSMARRNNTTTNTNNGGWCIKNSLKLIVVAALSSTGIIQFAIRESSMQLAESGRGLPHQQRDEVYTADDETIISPSIKKPSPTIKNESSPDAIIISPPTDKPQSTQPAVKQIVLLGERHSGTNWITDHLTDCFQGNVKVTNEYTRDKHWFQESDPQRVPENSAVVVAMFRDPYDWVEAMRVRPHHAHDHVNWHTSQGQGRSPLGWKKFVTKPWEGKRGPTDRKIAQTPGGIENTTCVDRYSFWHIAPCSPEDVQSLHRKADYKYELQHDGSERAYSSIIDLRRDKIMNHLSVANFPGTRAFFSNRFEDLNVNGTAKLLQNIEQATGMKAKCNATFGKVRRLVKKRITKHRELPDDYIQWMNRYVDWDVESRIGYYRRE